jgi:hypothetical protein
VDVFWGALLLGPILLALGATPFIGPLAKGSPPTTRPQGVAVGLVWLGLVWSVVPMALASEGLGFIWFLLIGAAIGISQHVRYPAP